MANILTTIAVSPEADGFFVIVSLNGQTVSKYGPMPDQDTAEAVQQEQVSIVNTTIREHVKRMRDELAQKTT